MARWNSIARGAAVAAVATISLAACSSEASDSGSSSSADGGSGEGLKVGSLLPITGSLAFLGPPEIAGVDLAIKEINEAGGVLGSDVTVQHEDSSDTDNPNITSDSVTKLLSGGVSVVIGAASSSVTLNAVDDITNAGVVQISPANTATSLSGYSPLYFRTAPPDTVQGNALGNLILEDGYSNIGVLVFNDDYGTSLRDVVQETVEAAGGSLTYGSSGQEFDPSASSFASDVQAILATNPEAIALIAFDQTALIIPELVAAGFDTSKLYLVDGNLADYSDELEAGALTGAKGTLPGASPESDFRSMLDSVADGGSLDEYAYGAESYDAVMLSALAAVRGGAVDGQTIADNLAAVSGAEGGTECTGFADCVALLEDGEEINYQTISGAGPFNSANDPSSAYIGVYEYGDDNTYSLLTSVYGEVPQG
ncbi:ABC transporter substrate-binding protein [Demequina rhizosphaerae]|uniref:ABC transporter substrate-binding protein n=1 Tax=Demequina rhizosphaerae TaxID=1638985 RepID=UPI000783BB69|nr:ABC transporter substrate-binding protein [Demequina rhizosphaerae]